MGLLERLQQKGRRTKKVRRPEALLKKRSRRRILTRELKKKIFARVVEEIHIDHKDNGEEEMLGAEEEIKAIAQEVIERQASHLTRNEKTIIIKEVILKTLGFGRLRPFCTTPTYPRVLVNTDLMRYM
jgi:hypothetical protein